LLGGVDFPIYFAAFFRELDLFALVILLRAFLNEFFMEFADSALLLKDRVKEFAEFVGGLDADALFIGRDCPEPHE
jgi:hypothetical protein